VSSIVDEENSRTLRSQGCGIQGTIQDSAWEGFGSKGSDFRLAAPNSPAADVVLMAVLAFSFFEVLPVL
jgi:hypothetical protein